MALCRIGASHYLDQCRPDSLRHICGIRGRLVNFVKKWNQFYRLSFNPIVRHVYTRQYVLDKVLSRRRYAECPSLDTVKWNATNRPLIDVSFHRNVSLRMGSVPNSTLSAVAVNGDDIWISFVDTEEPWHKRDPVDDFLFIYFYFLLKHI